MQINFRKKLIVSIVLLLLALVFAGIIFLQQLRNSTEVLSPSQDKKEEELPNGRVCIQVITPARNPGTGECKEFPTPCDVPKDWEKVNSCQ
ncbi:MAG: hypothetical protein HYS68_02555 [Candidatus Levybacteria bacterium]|nr:hypothetical protein [Candidatus Levybacteria bacterium]